VVMRLKSRGNHYAWVTLGGCDGSTLAAASSITVGGGLLGTSGRDRCIESHLQCLNLVTQYKLNTTFELSTRLLSKETYLLRPCSIGIFDEYWVS